MSKADEMFEKLGYEIAEVNKEDEYENICFEKLDRTRDGYYDEKFIIFWLEGINQISCYGLNEEKTITMQELQAINEKVKELGWNE
jgi:hypothetical protein